MSQSSSSNAELTDVFSDADKMFSKLMGEERRAKRVARWIDQNGGI